jgi:hypothetical protein
VGSSQTARNLCAHNEAGSRQHGSSRRSRPGNGGARLLQRLRLAAESAGPIRSRCTAITAPSRETRAVNRVRRWRTEQGPYLCSRCRGSVHSCGVDQERDRRPGIQRWAGRGLKVKELASTVPELTGNTSPIVFQASRPGDIRDSLADSSQFESGTGFRPATSSRREPRALRIRPIGESWMMGG